MSDLLSLMPHEGVLLTVTDVHGWEKRVADIEKEIVRLETELKETRELINAAKIFLSIAPSRFAKRADSPVVADVDDAKNAEYLARALPKHVENEASKKGTWANVVLEIVEGSELGLTYAEVRSSAARSILGGRLIKSDKGYHNAIGRLSRSGTIIREHGRLFTPQAHERFMRAVHAGEASTAVPQPMVHSPMGEAILKIVYKTPGINGKGIIAELRKNPEWDATLTPHETGAHNIIARLVRRRQILRRDDGVCLVGPSFPMDIVEESANRDEALNGVPTSASTLNSSEKGGDGDAPATT